MKNYIVALELVVQSYDEGAGPAAQNTTHSKRRLYASLPCAEDEIDAAVARIAGLANCDPAKLILESPIDTDDQGKPKLSKTGDTK